MQEKSSKTPMDELLEVMERLRDPEQGCPWDLKQSYKTIVPFTLEEAYEVADAIEREAFDELKGELGDLLFQVVFYCQLAKEESRFEFDDVAQAMVDKLIRRHPHVFSQLTYENDEAFKKAWEAQKHKERKARSENQIISVLDDIPNALPALAKAYKLQKRAASVGFDWEKPEQVIHKVEEELEEFKEALALGQIMAVEEELGDLMFALVNLMRKLKVNPEIALRSTNAKFERRFRYVEQVVSQKQGTAQASLKEMEEAWNQAKSEEKHIKPHTD